MKATRCIQRAGENHNGDCGVLMIKLDTDLGMVELDYVTAMEMIVDVIAKICVIDHLPAK